MQGGLLRPGETTGPLARPLALVVHRRIGHTSHAGGTHVAPEREQLRVEGVVVQAVGDRLNRGSHPVGPCEEFRRARGDTGGKSRGVVEVRERAHRQSRVG